MSDLTKFKVISIAKEDNQYKCNLCQSNRGFLAYFDTCEHSCCSNCIDNLFDTYDVKCFEELFKCPKCFINIYNIEYE